MTGFYIFWRVWVFLLWFGVMFAICTVIIGAALIAVLLAVVYGTLSPSRTVGGQLRSLQLHTTEGIALVQALKRRSA
jgi:hypothetical protein